MNARPLIIAAAVAAALASPFVLAQKPSDSGSQLASAAERGLENPEGTPTLTVNVPVGGALSTSVCNSDFTLNPASFQIPINLGPNAVITGLGGVGAITANAPSWMSEAAVVVRGAVPAEAIRFRPLVGAANNVPGTLAYNIPPIDLSGNALPNITGGATGNFILEFCETFNDPEVTVDAVWLPPSTITLSCFNCVDPFPPRAPVPSTSTWSLIGLLLALGLIGGIAVRRFS